MGKSPVGNRNVGILVYFLPVQQLQGYVHILSRVARASTYTFPAPLKNIMQSRGLYI